MSLADGMAWEKEYGNIDDKPKQTSEKGERNPHYIGKSEYKIYYKEPVHGKVTKFIGVCENFNPNGVCAFWNKEKEQMLLVVYWDIVGLYPELIL